MNSEQIREENREKVIGAGVTCLYRHGADQIQLEMVAGEAGVSKRSLLRYFDSKESLLLAVFGRINRDCFREIMAFCNERMKETMAADRKLEVLFESLRSLFRTRENRIITIVEVEIYLKDCPKSEFVKSQFLKIYEFYTSKIEEILFEGERECIFRDLGGCEKISADLIWNAYWGLMTQLTLSVKLGKYSLEYARRIIVEFIKRVIGDLCRKE
jgi:Transcriptional regulator